MFDAFFIYAPTRAVLERALAETAIACGEEEVSLCAAVEEKVPNCRKGRSIMEPKRSGAFYLTDDFERIVLV